MITFKQYILQEGGNVYKNPDGSSATSPVQRDDVFTVVYELERILNIDLKNNLLGSTGKKDISGDIDIAVDASKKSELINKLTDFCTVNGLDPKEYIKKTGISVHFKAAVPNTNQYAQVDFMLFNDIPFAKFRMANNEEPPLKGMHRNILLASLAKYRNCKLSNEALLNRETNAYITNNVNEIAQILFDDKHAVANDLSNIPSIVDKLKSLYPINKVKEILHEGLQTLQNTYNVTINI
jgi:hypothetical protein